MQAYRENRVKVLHNSSVYTEINSCLKTKASMFDKSGKFDNVNVKPMHQISILHKILIKI